MEKKSHPEILSFESSSATVFGDILSKRPTIRNKIKLGFLGCGYFEYWRMFSPEFKQNVISDLNKIYSRLNEDFDVVFPCVVDTLDNADIAGRTFAKEEIDILVVVEGTYIPDFITLHAIDYVSKVPVILFTTQTEEDISPNDDYESLMRNSALIGTAQLSGTFQKMNKAYEVVVGSIGEQRPYIEIAKLAKSYDISNRLKKQNVGIIGHIFRGMYDLENDKTKVKGTLGPNVVYVELSHLMKEWEKVTDEEGKAKADEYLARFKLRDVATTELYKSCKLGIAMERLIERLRLDSLCFLGQHYIEKETGAPARIGACMILEKDKYMVASEGDLAGLVVMQAMHWLTGNSPLQAEWGQYDASHNAVFIVGHGVASPAIAGEDSKITLTQSPEEWGFEGTGINMEFIMKPGPVTMAHLLDTAHGWQMIVSRGESLDYPCLPCKEIHALIRVEMPVKEYLVEIQRKGVPHHVIAVHGDICDELVSLAKVMGIDSFII